MILARQEAEELLSSHLEAVLSWHREAFKRRDAVRFDHADQWAAQPAALQGWWVTSLVVDEARNDQRPDRCLVPLGGFEAMEILDTARLAARLRFRAVALQPDEYGDVRPVITAPLSARAKAWFGNDHLGDPWQTTLLDDSTARRSHTNLLVGHSADPITAGLGRVAVACYLGARLHWWFDVDELGDSGRGDIVSTRPDSGPNRPPIAPIGITPKEKEQ